MFFANHQYDWSDGVLSSDLQYEHEDVLLSESRAMTSWQMSEKMLVGNALAGEHPLWNYIGTFEEKDYSKLRPKEVVAPIIASSIAHAARPWIVYFGFQDSQDNYPARREMSELLAWYAKNQDLYGGVRWAGVGVIVSLLNRNLHKRNLFPPHVKQLLLAKIPTVALRDDRLTAAKLNDFRIVTLENGDSMSNSTSHVLADWVRRGGMLIASPETGCSDELGRRRNPCVLWGLLGMDPNRRGAITVGRGKVIIADKNNFSRTVETAASRETFRVVPNSNVEVVPYRDLGRTLIHLIRHEPRKGSLTVKTPEAMELSGKSATVYAPEFAGRPKKVAVSHHAGVVSITIPDAPIYSVIVIE
jgi:hypothetical protein